MLTPPDTHRTPAEFREFCASAAIVMAEQVFDKAADDSASLTSKMEAAKWFAKMADYEPKANMVASAGSGFQLVVNFSNAPPATIGTGVVLDLKPEPERPVPQSLDNPPAFLLARPTHNAQFMDMTAMPDGED